VRTGERRAGGDETTDKGAVFIDRASPLGVQLGATAFFAIKSAAPFLFLGGKLDPVVAAIGASLLAGEGRDFLVKTLDGSFFTHVTISPA
jgi:hypothetical protein